MYAIIKDRTPNRATIVALVSSDDQDMLDVSREHDIPLSRIMWVRDGSEVSVGDRAWHVDETVQ